MAYLSSWEETIPWLQVLINHEDIDDVTLALERLQAGILAQEQGACYEACAELRENARHIFHRDAFTLGNVLYMKQLPILQGSCLCCLLIHFCGQQALNILDVRWLRDPEVYPAAVAAGIFVIHILLCILAQLGINGLELLV